MSGIRDSFLDLERHRLKLEENVRLLGEALRHWQTWDAEYEALKEEVDGASDVDRRPDDLHRIRDGFEGELLNRSEIEKIFGEQKLRSKADIITTLQRRIDYVTRNVESLRKQLETAENKLAAATVISQPDGTDEDGQPITDIIEELDDEGNVLSFRLNRAGDFAPQIQEALELADTQGPVEANSKPSQVASQLSAVSETSETIRDPAESVLLTNDTSSQPAIQDHVSDSAPDATELPPAASWRAQRVDRIMKTAKQQESIVDENSVLPEDEGAEEAELRRQMLKYSMGEVGDVVAELQLEDGGEEEDDYSDDEAMNDYDYDDDDGDDEDKYGRTTSRVVTDGYRQRMLELQRRLAVRSQHAEDEGEDDESSDEDEGIGRIHVRQETDVQPTASLPPVKSSIKTKVAGEADEKKGVRFAQQLDIAPDNRSPSPMDRDEPEEVVNPLSDVLERAMPMGSSEAPTPSIRKPSRFRMAAKEQAVVAPSPESPLDMPSRFLEQEAEEPSGPEGSTLADVLVEREPSSAPKPPSDSVDVSSLSAVALEHQRLRTKFIQRQGGFLKPDESPVEPLDESEGGPERLSRFKAARLSSQ